jgi:hypothetical protein
MPGIVRRFVAASSATRDQRGETTGVVGAGLDDAGAEPGAGAVPDADGVVWPGPMGTIGTNRVGVPGSRGGGGVDGATGVAGFVAVAPAAGIGVTGGISSAGDPVVGGGGGA